MKKLFFYCLLFVLPNFGWAQQQQPTLTLEAVEAIKQKSATVITLNPQKLPFREKQVLRFAELGSIYNPNFPNTRHRVLCHNFQTNGTIFEYINKSVSTHRATIFLHNRTGKFTSAWYGENCVSLVEYQVVKKGDFLEVTGKVYTCLPES